MRSTPDGPKPFEPTAPSLVAAAICTVAALTLLWPLLTGQILFGGFQSDMFKAGYSFRLFGAETFKATGSIPQWNPYILGGLPYIAAMHGDIFYPTAWLRWIMPVDLAITWGMAVHFVLAGWLTYGFARALRLSWGAAVVAGVMYELSGIVASQMSPGHDGKLFVSALTPLAFWVLMLAIRGGRRWAFGAFAIVVALLVLGHFEMCYFLLIALGLWAIYLAFWDPERRANANPWIAIAFSAGAVVVGLGISGLQFIPFLEYIKYSPRADGGPSTGWAFATNFSMPPAEIFTAILPQLNGVLDNYFGSNPFKFHTEYIGFLPLALAALAWGDRSRRRLVSALLVGVAVFLLFAFGGATPFYRALFNVLPELNKMRAIGMVFFLVAFFVCVLAGIGLDRVFARTVSSRTILWIVAGFALFALLGAVGGLQGLAELLADPDKMGQAEANAPALRIGALRLLIFVLLGGTALWAIAARRVEGWVAIALLLLVTAGDLWSMDRLFYNFSPRADRLFAADAVTTYLQKTAPPYRVLDPGNSYGGSILMAYRIPIATGYQGNELRAYDELGDADDPDPRHRWHNLFSLNLIDLLSIRFLILGGTQTVPGYHRVVPPTTTSLGTPAVLYERDTVPAYARVIVAAAKVPEAQAVQTLIDPRFPVNSVVLFPDTSSVHSDSLTTPLPTSAVRATVTAWAPGHMTIALAGADARQGHLLISENWYPDWHATVDGKPGVVRRADHTLLSVDLPAGAREVTLWFDSPAYALGKIVSLIALLIAVAGTAAPLWLARRCRSAPVLPLSESAPSR